MEWLSEAITALAAVRALHFAASALTTGVLLFRAIVARPATIASNAAKVAVDAQIHRLAVVGLVAAILTGGAWFVLVAAEMGALPAHDALNWAVLQTVLAETQFGWVAAIRLVLAIVLGVCLAFDRAAPARWLSLAAAVGFVGAIAWTGHAGSGFGVEANFHVAADVLHLLAAAAWIGGLVPLALLLAAAKCHHVDAWAAVARDVTRRFSTLGMASVAILMVSGLINAWFLVGSLNALLPTVYGRLLLMKISLFALMIAIAAVNRLVLTPRLAPPGATGHSAALRKLTRNSVIEIILGLMIFAIVGALGTLHPAIHLVH